MSDEVKKLIIKWRKHADEAARDLQLATDFHTCARLATDKTKIEWRLLRFRGGKKWVCRELGAWVTWRKSDPGFVFCAIRGHPLGKVLGTPEDIMRKLEMDDDGLMTVDQTIGALGYIAESPGAEHGGFDPMTVRVAKSALKYLKNQRNDEK